MKRTILTALAATMLAASAFGSAQATSFAPQPPTQGQAQLVDWKPSKKVVKRHVVRRDGHVVKRKVVTKRWERGNRLSYAQRRNVVRDYNRYHLRRPPQGQQWVRVNDEFLLVSAATGLIMGIIAAN